MDKKFIDKDLLTEIDNILNEYESNQNMSLKQSSSKSSKSSKSASKQDICTETIQEIKIKLTEYIEHAKRQIKNAKITRNEQALSALVDLLNIYESNILLINQGENFDILKKFNTIKNPFDFDIKVEDKAEKKYLELILKDHKEMAQFHKSTKNYDSAKIALKKALIIKKWLDRLNQGETVFLSQIEPNALEESSQEDVSKVLRRKITKLIERYIKAAKENKTENKQYAIKCLQTAKKLKESLETDLKKIDEKDLIFIEPPESKPQRDITLVSKETQRKGRNESLLLKRIQKQEKILKERVNFLTKLKEVEMASKYSKLMVETQKSIEILQQAINNNEKTPGINVTKIVIPIEHVNKDVPFDQIKVNISDCSISSLPFYVRKPFVFLAYSLALPNTTQKSSGETEALKCAKNEKFDFPDDIMIQITRQKGIATKIRLAKIHFVLEHAGSLKKTQLGRAELKVSGLYGQSQFRKEVKFTDSGKTVATAVVNVFANVPYGKMNFKEVKYSYIVVNKPTSSPPFFQKEKEKEKEMEKEKEKGNGTPKTPESKLSKAEAKDYTIPSNLSSDMINDPLNVSFYVSNDTLEFIKEKNSSIMNDFLTKGKIPPKRICSELKEASVILSNLENSVDTGEINFESYLENVKESVSSLENLVSYLKHAGRKLEEREVGERLLVMKNELKEADDFDEDE